MFEYFIRKNKPVMGVRTFRDIAKDNGVMHVLGPRREPQQQQERIEPSLHLTPEQFVKASRFARKEVWTAWIEGVKNDYPKGKIMTLRAYPIVLNRPTAPFAFFVDFIQEVRTLAQWDSIVSEPRVVGLRPVDRNSIYHFSAPGALRDLTEEELNLVHLHNPKVKELIAEALKAPAEEPANDGYVG